MTDCPTSYCDTSLDIPSREELSGREVNLSSTPQGLAAIFSARLDALMRQRGYTCNEVARRMTAAGYPIQSPQMWKLRNGRANPSIRTAEGLAVVFGVDTGVLFTQKDASALARESLVSPSHRAVLDVLDVLDDATIDLLAVIARALAESVQTPSTHPLSYSPDCPVCTGRHEHVSEEF